MIVKTYVFILIFSEFFLNYNSSAQENIVVGALPMGVSTQYMGLTVVPNLYDFQVFNDLGVNTNRIFSNVEDFEPVDDNGIYGRPTINEVKGNIDIIPWTTWDNAISSKGMKTYLDKAQANHIKVILNLKSNANGWMANIPKTPEDDNEWWEHCAALAYWLNVRNDYKIDDYQLLNEPDQGIGQEFTGTKEDYVRLARLTKDALDFVYSHFLPGRKYETYGPVVSWANDWISDVLTNGGNLLSTVDFHEYASKTQFTDAIRGAHNMMNSTGYAGLPLWMTEWGSYDNDLPNVRQNTSNSFSIKMINNIINMCAPGDGHVNGWEYYTYGPGSYGDELLDENKTPRTVYYALRLAIRGLKGGKPVYNCNVSNNKLKAIGAKDEDGTIYILVTDTSSANGHTLNVDLSALSPVVGSSSTIYRYDSSNSDVQSSGPAIDANGIIQITIPSQGAVLLKVQGTGNGKDTEAPTTPSTLTSGNPTDNSVTLTWGASSDNVKVDYYDVYIDEKNLKSAKGDATSLLVDKLKPSSTYSIYIKARDAAGNVSSASNTISVTTAAASNQLVTIKPPTNLTASATDSSVTLLWALSTDSKAKAYKIYQDNSVIATISGSGYIINGLTADKQYIFKISAIDSIVSESPFAIIPIKTESKGVKKLTGTVFGFGLSTDPNWYGTAFDGNVITYYDSNSSSPDGNGGYCGIDLGQGVTKKITKIRFVLARGGWAAGRIIGGKFQGSNISETKGYFDLYTIKNDNDGVWNQIEVNNLGGYRYLRYLAPDGSYGNINEIEFYGVDGIVSLLPPTPEDFEVDGTPSLSGVNLKWKSGGDVPIKGYKIYQGNNYVVSTDSSVTRYAITGLTANIPYTFKVTSFDHSDRESLSDSLVGIKISVDNDTTSALISGTFFGTSPSYAAGNEYDKVFDKDVNTIFDYSQESGGYTGIQLNSINGKRITKIRFYPRGGGKYFTDRMVGGKFQGSNTSKTEGYTDLYTVPSTLNADWNEIVINDTNTYLFLRYLGPDGSYCDVAEIEFYGKSIATGIGQLTEKLSKIEVYPNPVTDITKIYLKSTEPVELNITIYNSLGVIVSSSKIFVSGEKSIPLNLSDQTKGVYIIKIQNKNSFVTKTIVK